MSVVRQYPAPQKKQSSNEPSWFLVVMLSGIISGILLFTIGWYLSLSEAERHTVMKKLMSSSDMLSQLNVFHHSKVLLVMGVDMPPLGSKEAYRSVRTDTMMLVKVDTTHKKVNIVSLPRDSKVFIPGHGIDKLNAAFTFGGPELAVATVEQSMGIDVDNYLVVNLSGVKEVVDALGGVDVYVEKPMHYKDYTAKLFINLEPGLHHMDGTQAEGYLRFRHDALGDIGRIRRQQQFISAVSNKLKDPATILRIKPLLEAANRFTLTDLPPQDLIGLAVFGKDLTRKDYQVATLPGHPSMSSQVSYWVIDPQAAEQVLNRLIVGIDEGSQVVDTPTVGLLYTPNSDISIAKYKERLEAAGFQVRCQSRIRPSATRIVIHHTAGHEIETRLQQTHPALKDAQLIFSPHGATFESNSCGNTDFTIILGDDTRSAANE